MQQPFESRPQCMALKNGDTGNTKQELNSSTYWVSVLRVFICLGSGMCVCFVCVYVCVHVLGKRGLFLGWIQLFCEKQLISQPFCEKVVTQRSGQRRRHGPVPPIPCLAFSVISECYILQRSVGSAAGIFRHTCKRKQEENTSHFNYLLLCNRLTLAVLNSYYFIIISLDSVGWLGYAGWIFCPMWCQLGLQSSGRSVSLERPRWFTHMANVLLGIWFTHMANVWLGISHKSAGAVVPDILVFCNVASPWSLGFSQHGSRTPRGRKQKMPGA